MKLPRMLAGLVRGAGLAAALWFVAPQRAEAAEPAACLSNAPSDWPAASKPYFLVIADSSGTMTNTVSAASSCGYGSDRLAHLRCALRRTFEGYSGDASFGLMTFPTRPSNCLTTCYASCTYGVFPGGDVTGCGTGSGASRAGGFLRVPVWNDWFWSTPPQADNTPSLLALTDNSCSGNQELTAFGNGPTNGALRDAQRYFAGSYVDPATNAAVSSPLSAQDLVGSGSAPCRSVNVALVVDGDDNCDAAADANAAAAQLLAGVSVGGKTFKIKTYVLALGVVTVNHNALAAAGGTGAAFAVSNEGGLVQALSQIVTGALPAEVADNQDNDCNGCTDEGYPHYANVQTLPNSCCAFTRASCLANYQASITPTNPQGNLALLPCTSLALASLPSSWLLYPPGETCDGADNDGDGLVDESLLTCGGHCPRVETCNGEDDNCDGVVDEGVCNGCVPSPEVCDGCDNDCDGLIDENIAAVPCGLASPANCAGQRTCPAQAPSTPGACVASTGYLACNNAPATDGCDGIDNDCDGVLDNACQPAAAVPATGWGGTALLAMALVSLGAAALGRRRAALRAADG